MDVKYNKAEQTSDTELSSLLSLEFPNRLFFLFAFDFGKYVTTAAD